MAIPKAFISYSHDSQDHKKWVLDFATRLRNNGVDAALDQWDLGPGADLPSFMEKNLAVADRVLMICTENYVAKANSGTGGVGYEKMIVTADLMKSVDSTKVIPLIRQNGTHSVPTFLSSKMYLDFSREDQFEFSYDELLRSLHGAPLFIKPPVASNPFTPVSATPPEKTGDGVLQTMRVIVKTFEATLEGDILMYATLLGKASMSRIMFDIYLGQAAEQGLISRTSQGNIKLTSKGKTYAVEHKLIRT
ncbi:TIR domain-containing protein [Variovorax beijingensis]|uniref:TIR domain-containing protein n=1 Tax=Variovorax beijingensis TaxID=2496117 RepID=A0ABY0A9Q1_9BURK|nr:toll/interleukin-1 receptor domain-containing protein [Variovorax beijingensis]RSZ40268.1 TIR domain-containing protein [Variovorax beijingensis]